MEATWPTSGSPMPWTRRGVRSTSCVRPQPPESYDAMTPCPGWSVKDILSHLVGFEKMLHGEPVPEYHGEWPNYVHNPIGEFNEAFVQANRDRPGLEVLDELRDQCARSIAALRALDDAGWEKVGWSPGGGASVPPVPRDAGRRQLDPSPGHPRRAVAARRRPRAGRGDRRQPIRVRPALHHRASA